MADFALSDALLRTARRAALVKGASAEKRTEIEEVWGKQAVARYLATDEARANREAEALLTHIEKVHTDVPQNASCAAVSAKPFGVCPMSCVMPPEPVFGSGPPRRTWYSGPVYALRRRRTVL